jgi:2-polyprenyl-3-methyl-5-hydroxy-6-metoxy-1,4-benzoquinol methylase
VSADQRTATSDAAEPSAAPTVPTGNTTDKYDAKNPLQRRLVANFRTTLDEVFTRIEPRTVLDVGCGEGVLTEEMADRLDGRRIVGIDLDDPKLHAEWERRSRPNLEYRAVPAERVPFSEGEFDVATAIEVLEHVPKPETVLAEMSRVADRYLLVSVPREPIWRVLNMARGAYLRDWGNTPGHLNHWSKRGFIGLLERFGRVEEVRSPFPWTMALVRVS